MGQRLPDSVELAVAIHRDGVSRMRAVYDHRIRREREAPDLGLDHFARHLAEYCALYPSIAHHCKPQSAWLGSDQNAFTDILPLDRLDLLVELVRKVTGQDPPPLQMIHATQRKTPVSEEAAKWLREWTAHDTALGWDGVTLRLFDEKTAGMLADNGPGQTGEGKPTLPP